MRKLRCASVALLVFWLGLLSPSQAHSPYFGQREKIDLSEFGVVEFAVLYGDGIFFADPSQVVVFDKEGKLLAATPQSAALFILCNRSNSAPTCSVYDIQRGLMLEPVYEQWARGRLIVEEGRPSRDAYPEYMDIENGFTQRPAAFTEKVRIEAASILTAPISTLLSVLWWAGACSFVTRLFWRWRASGWKILPVRAKAVVSVFVSFLIFLWMSFLAAYAWLLQPYSDIFFAFAFLSGALIAAILTRPKGLSVQLKS